MIDMTMNGLDAEMLQTVDNCLVTSRPFNLDDRKIAQYHKHGRDIYANELQDSLADYYFFYVYDSCHKDRVDSDYSKSAE